MPLNFYAGSTVEDNEVGIVAPSDLEINFHASHLRRNGVAIEIYQPDFAKQYGLPQQTPFDLVEELAKQLVKAQSASVEEKLEIASKSRLNIWLTNTASVVKTTKDLVEIGLRFAAVFSQSPPV